MKVFVAILTFTVCAIAFIALFAVIVSLIGYAVTDGP